MSLQRKTAITKGKVVEGTGSILANFDAETRKAFAKCANKAEKTRAEHNNEVVLQSELTAYRDKKDKKRIERKLRNKPLTYWLVSASFSEIWRYFFPK